MASEFPLARPIAALEFKVSPVTACRVGSRLSSRAAIFDWSKVRSAFGFAGSGGFAACTGGFGGGFFSSFFSASAIGSILGGSGFFSIGFGSSFGLASATGFGGSGFFSTGLSSTFGVGGGAVSVTTGGFSLILPTASSAGLASATFSTSGFGLSFLPLFMPAFANALAETTSTVTDSSGLVSNALVANDTSPHPITRTCRVTDAASVLSTLKFTPSGPLIHFGHQRQMLEARARQLSHHPGHGSIVGLFVSPHVDTLVHAAAGIGDRLQFG